MYLKPDQLYIDYIKINYKIILEGIYMKKLLAVATIGVVGYLVVKKIKERKNNDVVEVNEEMENEEVVENVVEEQPEVEVVDNVEEEIVPENNNEITREEMIQEMANCVKNIQENEDYMEKIYEVCDDIFDTNNEEFEKLFKDLDM